MTLVSPQQSNPNDEINASDVNNPVNQLAAVINGGLDDANISALSGTKISAGTLPASAATTDANVETRLFETLGNLVVSGGVWSSISGLNGTMTAAIDYINGKRVPVSLITTHGFTASKDTYVSHDVNGSVAYSEVANGASAPSIPSNSVWDYKIVTDASSITRVEDLRLLPLSSGSRTWDPVLANLTVGSGTLVAYFDRIGKWCEFSVAFTFGAGSSVGSSPKFSLPVPARAVNQPATKTFIGLTYVLDTGTAEYTGPVILESATQAAPIVGVSSGAYNNFLRFTSAIPMTWTTGDVFVCTGRYEVGI